jgi:SAM-dependent methyltransferase
MSDEDLFVVDWAAVADRLTGAAHGDRSWYESVAATLLRPGDALAADIGCGGGGMTAALAVGLGPRGRVLAVDGSPAVLDAARATLADLPPDAAPVRFVRADLDGDMSTVDRELHLVWASAAVHHSADQQKAVNALADLLAPDGRLALSEGGLAAKHLPWDLGVGEPGIEIRLIAAQDRWFAEMRSRLPGSVPMPYGWTTALRRAGLVDVRSRSWLIEQPAPIEAQQRLRVVDQLSHRVDRLRSSGFLTESDLAAWDRLLDRCGPDWLGHRDDLFHLEARTVQVGTAAR